MSGLHGGTSPSQLATVAEIRECPMTNPPTPLERIAAAMTARVLHPGHAGVLNGPLPSDATLRRDNPLWMSKRMAYRSPYR